MRRTPCSLRWIVIFLVIPLALTACERPIPREDETDVPDVIAPTSTPLVIPTPIPTEMPTPEILPTSETGVPSDTGTGTDTQPVEQPTEVPTGDTTGDTSVPETPATEAGSYTVLAGDTLGQIADRFGLTVEEIATANGISNIDTLEVGQVLTIPAPGTVETPSTGEERTHIVKSGENLFRIGLAYGFTAEELASYNGITNVNRIEVGQVIRIPPEN